MNANRFGSGGEGIENGGMFSREQIHHLTQYILILLRQVMELYGNGQDEVEPADLARCMIDTYRGMNKHFIPTGYELSSFAKVFDRSHRGKLTS